MNDLIYSAESITHVEGVKIEATRKDFIYYTIRFQGGSIPEGSIFQGFGDPDVYGYALGAPLYTNIVVENRIPDASARWWALTELRISLPGAKVQDVVSLITSMVFTLSVLKTGDDPENPVNLLIAPLLSLPSDEGIGLERHNYTPGANTFKREMLQTMPIPGAYYIGCKLSAGKALLLEGPVDLYVVAHVAYFYAARDKRTEREPPKAMSAPSGVRFSTEAVDQINALVESGAVSSKSEFIRTAVDEALERQGGGS